MEREYFGEKFEDLLKGFTEAARQRMIMLLACGAIDMGSYPDDMTLPRIIFYDCLVESLASVRHFIPENCWDEVQNLRAF